jgi:hypothetical protein
MLLISPDGTIFASWPGLNLWLPLIRCQLCPCMLSSEVSSFKKVQSTHSNVQGGRVHLLKYTSQAYSLCLSVGKNGAIWVRNTYICGGFIVMIR